MIGGDGAEKLGEGKDESADVQVLAGHWDDGFHDMT